MKRRRILLMLALIALVAGLVLFWPRGPKEPVYEGKRLTRWIEEGYNRNTPESHETTRRVLKAIGTNALPFLLHQFARKDPRWIESLKYWAYSHRIMSAQYHADLKRFYRDATPIRQTAGPHGAGANSSVVRSRASGAVAGFILPE